MLDLLEVASLTEHKESQCIVVTYYIIPIGCLNSEKRRDNGTKATIEETKCGEDGIRIRVPEDKLPLR